MSFVWSGLFLLYFILFFYCYFCKKQPVRECEISNCAENSSTVIKCSFWTGKEVLVYVACVFFYVFIAHTSSSDILKHISLNALYFNLSKWHPKGAKVSL